MTRQEAEKLVLKFESALADASHKLANAANHHFVDRVREELIQKLVDEKVQS